jgi:PBP1b-binding outer membrane lipoprotein LpoB
MRTSLILALPAVLLLAGCVSTDAQLAPGEGTFASTNFAEQVVDPTPAEGAPEMDAMMSAAAIGRYRRGETKVAEDDREDKLEIVLPGM